MNSNLKDKLNKAPEKMVQVSDLVLCPLNPRKVMGDLKGLGESLQEKQTDALIVRPKGSKFEIVAGTRRTEASKLIGVLELRAKIADLTDDEVRDIIATQDEHSLKMTPLERGLLYSEMLHKKTLDEVSKDIGVEKTKIHRESTLVRRLPATFLQRCNDGVGNESKDFKTITTQKAVVLAESGLSMKEIEDIGTSIEQTGMTHRDVVHKVKELKGELKEKLEKEFYQDIMERLSQIYKDIHNEYPNQNPQILNSATTTIGPNGRKMREITPDKFKLEEMETKKTKKLAPFELGKDEAPTLEDAKKWVKKKDGNLKNIREEDDYWIVSIPEEVEEE